MHFRVGTGVGVTTVGTVAVGVVVVVVVVLPVCCRALVTALVTGAVLATLGS